MDRVLKSGPCSVSVGFVVARSNGKMTTPTQIQVLLFPKAPKDVSGLGWVNVRKSNTGEWCSKMRVLGALQRLLCGIIGGIVALVVAASFLWIAGNPVYEARPAGYENPSAAAGQSVATLIGVVVLFALGASLGVIAKLMLGHWRNSMRQAK
jgi:hypothetical protein